jgi:hypothetical protein
VYVGKNAYKKEYTGNARSKHEQDQHKNKLKIRETKGDRELGDAKQGQRKHFPKAALLAKHIKKKN